MTNPRIKFHIRLRDSTSLIELGQRVSKALNFSFNLSSNKQFEGREVLETDALGLWITLAFWPRVNEGEIRTYRLVGDIPEDVRKPWGEEFIDISQFILGVLTRRDSHEWYIPDLEELFTEAGLPWPDEGHG